MPPTTRQRNRGPAAAADNRAALVAAGRRLFAEQGYAVPLSAVARAAGVGQGVLYRHFPARTDLALAVFSDNIDEIEQLAAAHPGPDGFLVLWRRVVEHMLESSAFVDALIHAGDLPEWSGAERLERVLAGPLGLARAAGLVDDRLTPDDVLLLLRLLYGVVVTAPDRTTARDSLVRALTLVDPRLATALADG
jgi:AcrR family transcriptional regulator